MIYWIFYFVDFREGLDSFPSAEYFFLFALSSLFWCCFLSYAVKIFHSYLAEALLYNSHVESGQRVFELFALVGRALKWFPPLKITLFCHYCLFLLAGLRVNGLCVKRDIFSQPFYFCRAADFILTVRAHVDSSPLILFISTCFFCIKSASWLRTGVDAMRQLLLVGLHQTSCSRGWSWISCLFSLTLFSVFPLLQLARTLTSVQEEIQQRKEQWL